MFRVVFFEADGGRLPVREFLADLPQPEARARLLRAIERLGELGFLPEPFTKSIAGSRKLRELRVNHGGDTYRIFYSLVSNRRIVLLHAFKKKSRKTPAIEIRVAQKRLTRFMEVDDE
ncbi:type II toxin-antitoxin system RelE/ParE family toxin [bacterium]|nr:type II toxin-antitoxin system RelE/ParE family toxin [bacterium]